MVVMVAAVEAVATAAAVVEVAVAAVMAAAIADRANPNLYSIKKQKRPLSQVGRFLLIPFREAAVMCR